MDLRIKGRTALLVGATSGLGLAIAKQLADEGANLVLFSRDTVKLEVAAGELRPRKSIKVTTIAGDMTKPEDVARLVRQLRAGEGFDLLFLNNARPPMPMHDALDEKDDQRWETAFRTQLWGSVLTLREVVPILVERNWGRVVIMTSGTVKQPMPKHALSTVFRAGLTGFMKHLANEVAANGVTVNAICPAGVLTENLRKSHNLEERKAMVPMKRLGTEEELASTVVFYLSDQAGFITGSSVQVDGGMYAGLL